MRLFFAIELPSDVRDALGRLRPKDESRDYRWVDPALMHVTLAFLGEQPAEQLAVLQTIGAAAANASQRGLLQLGTAGSFGSRRAPRVLWVDLVGDVEGLLSLQHRLDAALQQAGFAVSEQSFRAHVTLARRREGARGGPPQLSAPPHATFTMAKLTLMQSRLSPRGPTYTAVSEFPIGG